MIQDTESYQRACTELAELNTAYRLGEPKAADHYYDTLRKAIQDYEFINQLDTSASPAELVGEVVVVGLQHRARLLSLENALTAAEAKEWVTNWRKLGSDSICVIGEYKYNGMACRLTYQDGILTKALSRGDGTIGVDITERVKAFVPNTINIKALVEVTGEIVLPLSVYTAEHTDDYVNPLAATVALVRGQGFAYHQAAAQLILIPYDVYIEGIEFNTHEDKLMDLTQLGFQHISYFKTDLDNLEDINEQLFKNKGTVICDTDGVVWKLNSTTHQKLLGSTNHHPKHAFAYKYPPVFKSSVLLEVIFQVGFTGVVTPVAKITPAILMGKEVSSVSLANEARLKDLGVAIGNEYAVCLSGDVIPYISHLIQSSGTELVTFPSTCPCCQSGLVKEGEEWFCKNDCCTERIVGLLTRAVSREYLNIVGMSEKTIRNLVTLGITTIAGIYMLTIEQLLTLPKVTQFTAAKLLAAIALSRETTLDKFIAALGIDGISLVTASALATKVDAITLYTLKTTEAVLARGVPGIGKVLANNIAQFFSDDFKVLRATELHDQLILRKDALLEIVPVEGIDGKQFVITGKFDLSRDIIEEIILEAGGTISDKVSKQTDYLLVGDKPSSKLKLAQVAGIETLTLKELQTLLTKQAVNVVPVK